MEKQAYYHVECSDNGKADDREVLCLYVRNSTTRKKVREAALKTAAEDWYGSTLNKKFAVWIDGKRVSFTAEECERMRVKAAEENWLHESIAVTDHQGKNLKKVVAIRIGKYLAVATSLFHLGWVALIHTPTKRELDTFLLPEDAVTAANIYTERLGDQLDVTDPNRFPVNEAYAIRRECASSRHILNRRLAAIEESEANIAKSKAYPGRKLAAKQASHKRRKRVRKAGIKARG